VDHAKATVYNPTHYILIFQLQFKLSPIGPSLPYKYSSTTAHLTLTKNYYSKCKKHGIALTYILHD